MVVESHSVIRNGEKRAGAGERQSGHRPLSQVVRALFSLCSFQYFPTILSESLAQAKLCRICSFQF